MRDTPRFAACGRSGLVQCILHPRRRVHLCLWTTPSGRHVDQVWKTHCRSNIGSATYTPRGLPRGFYMYVRFAGSEPSLTPHTHILRMHTVAVTLVPPLEVETTTLSSFWHRPHWVLR